MNFYWLFYYLWFCLHNVGKAFKTASKEGYMGQTYICYTNSQNTVKLDGFLYYTPSHRIYQKE